MIQNWIDNLYTWSTENFIDYRKYLKESLGAICLALLVRSLLITFYKIPSGSMIPTFEIGDVILADRYQFGWKIPFTSHKDGYRVGLRKKLQKGDIVIFQAPPEKDFWNIQVQIKKQTALPLLLEINRASSKVKRPLNRLSDGTPNYVFPPPPFFEQKNNSLIIPTIQDTQGNTTTHITMHPTIYAQYLPQIQSQQDALSILGKKRIRLYTSYAEEDPWQLISLLQLPITGICLISEVCLQTPILLFPRLFLFSMLRPFQDTSEKLNLPFFVTSIPPWQEFLIDFFSFSVYPNAWIDTRKDFVKRVVATEGDTIEIINGQLRINGSARELSTPISQEASGITTYETSVQNASGNILKHKIKKQITPLDPEDLIPFDQELWPYDPTLQSFYVKNMIIGPITIPPGHFFAMGDNTEASLDSRCWGFVPLRALKGYPRLKVWPSVGKIF